MSKITNLNAVLSYAFDALQLQDYDLVNMTGLDVAALIVTNIYMMGNLTSGYGQDIIANISVISSPKRMTVIFDGQMSFYQESEHICGYEDIETDMMSICNAIQAAIERVNARQ